MFFLHALNGWLHFSAVQWKWFSCEPWHTASAAGKCEPPAFNLLCWLFFSLILKRVEKCPVELIGSLAHRKKMGNGAIPNDSA